MSYDAQSRDKHRRTVAVVTGAMTVGAISATGWLAGHAARDFEQEQAEQREAQEKAQARYERTLARSARPARPEERLRQRPTRTRITTRYVSGDAPAAPVVNAPSAPDPAPAPPAPQPAAPPPPAPEPPPAPSSGS
jgi:hypothetical protein